MAAVIDFAELDDFIDLKVKNYSSGMLVRLSFSMLTEVEADILLVDEVLAVGDAAFQQKCFDLFAEFHDQGRTIVLVTHDVTSVERKCDRALLIEDGRIEEQGDPGDVARRYLAINFEDYRGGDTGEVLDWSPRAGSQSSSSTLGRSCPPANAPRASLRARRFGFALVWS